MGTQGEGSVIDMKFQSENEAYDFYNSYAKSVGFSIRKHWKSNSKKDGSLLWRIFCCSCQGEREKHSTKGTPGKPRPQKRFNCNAHLKIEVDKTSGIFFVSSFINEHTHELTKPNETHMLRSHRGVRPVQRTLINDMASAGIGSSSIYYYMSKEAGGFDKVNFTQSDCDNVVQKRRIDFLKQGDGQLLFDFFKKKEKENNGFFYDIQLDDNNQIRTCFWCDAKARIDYQNFGDVVCFDTTYQTNDYDMPFAPFVGVNNHMQTVIFAGALLNDEKADTFVWLFKTFLNAMGGKKMETIFTDQGLGIVKAISVVFPDTHHRLCIWHIYQNALRNLSHVFKEFKTFADDFKRCIYQAETEEEFFSQWNELLEKYDLKHDEWLDVLFHMREKWAQVYARGHFCAGMASTQRSESINNYFKKYFKRKQILREFIDQYDKAVSLRRQKEANADVNSKTTTPNLLSRWPVEEYAAKFYTRKVFNRFQHSLQAAFDWEANVVSDDGTICTYYVVSYNGYRSRTVVLTYSDNTMTCSCRKFQFIGILCSHMIRVYRTKNVRELPSQYFLSRWSKSIAPDVTVDGCGNILEADTNPSLSLRYNELSRMALKVATEGAICEAVTEIAKHGLEKVLNNIRSCLASIQNKDAPRNEEDSTNVVDEDVAYPLVSNAIVLAPPKNTKGNRAVRIKGFYDSMKKRGKAKQMKRTAGITDIEDQTKPQQKRKLTGGQVKPRQRRKSGGKKANGLVSKDGDLNMDYSAIDFDNSNFGNDMLEIENPNIDCARQVSIGLYRGSSNFYGLQDPITGQVGLSSVQAIQDNNTIRPIRTGTADPVAHHANEDDFSYMDMLTQESPSDRFD